MFQQRHRRFRGSVQVRPGEAEVEAKIVSRPDHALRQGSHLAKALQAAPLGRGFIIPHIRSHRARPVSARLATGGIEGETRQSLANIREVLANAGMDFKDVVSVTAFITDFKDFDKFNAVYREYFPTDPPARATVQVAALNIGARVELQMIAVKR